MAARPNGTATKIIEAALRTLARQGPENFSMAGIGRQAGVSRRTLYRYFHSSDEVLQEVAVHVGNSYQNAIEAAVVAEPTPDRRVEVVLYATMHFGDYEPAALAVLRLDPTFTLRFIEQTIEHYVEVLRVALDPVSEQIPGVASGRVTVVEVAELVIRLGISGFSLHSLRVDTVPTAFAALISAGGAAPRGRRSPDKS